MEKPTVICSYHGSKFKPLMLHKVFVRSSAVNGGRADYDSGDYEELNFLGQGIPFLSYSEM